jgi:uncharacterized protein with ParB-like and HNH nuclease domain
MCLAESRNVDMIPMRKHGLKHGIVSVKELLSLEKIQIPEYQRPYKWTIKNVNQLIDDILLHKKNPPIDWVHWLSIKNR